MKVRELIEKLQKLAEEKPETLEMIAVKTLDDDDDPTDGLQITIDPLIVIFEDDYIWTDQDEYTS